VASVTGIRIHVLNEQEEMDWMPVADVALVTVEPEF
jgi:hypothetical protein